MKRFDKSTGLICTQKLASFFHHHAAALRTLLCGRFLPGHEITIRIILASVVFTAFFRLTDDNLLAALRAFNADFFQIWFGVFTVRKTGTSQEFSVGTIFDNKVSAASGWTDGGANEST